MKKMSRLVIAMLAGMAVFAETSTAAEIVHDGEHNFLKAQYGKEWAVEDLEIDAQLGEIRDRNGGKPPNILYILIDDVSFGQMGNRALNYVTGIKTPNINGFAE